MQHEKFAWMHSFFVANLLIEQDGGATDSNIIINETMTLVNSLNETSLFYNPKIDVIIGFLATHGFIIDAEPYQEMVADALEEFVQCSQCSQYFTHDNETMTCRACPYGQYNNNTDISTIPNCVPCPENCTDCEVDLTTGLP